MVVKVGKNIREEYANLVAVSASESEYCLDFALVEPSGQEAKVVARLILTPKVVEQLRDILDRQLKEGKV